MSLESSFCYFAAILFFAITPGPGTMAIIARTLVHGAGNCLSLVLGLIVSDIAYLVMAYFGLGAIATNWSTLFTCVRVVGALYLFYLAYKAFTTKVEVQEGDVAMHHTSFSAGLLQGFLISASNPKVILFYIAFLPTFIDLQAMTGVDLLVLVVLTFIGLLVGLMSVAHAGASARKIFTSVKAVKRLNRTAGGVMVAAGTYLLTNE